MFFYRWKNIGTFILLSFGLYHVLDILTPQTKLTTLQEGNQWRLRFIRICGQLYALSVHLRLNWEEMAYVHTVFLSLGVFEYGINRSKENKEYLYLGVLILIHGLFSYETPSILQILVCMETVESLGELIEMFGHRVLKRPKNKRIRQITIFCSLLIQGLLCASYIWNRSIDLTAGIYLFLVPYLASKQVELLVDKD